MSQIDVSVVLNMHREALYLRPTLYSLDACAIEAVQQGIKVELIAVFDRADAATMAVFQSTPITGFAAVKVIEIDVGSLGLARNAGIDHAEGEFVWTADADDLVSRNSIVRLVETAYNHPNKDVVVFIEYLAAFGDQYHVVRYVGSELLTAADFAFHHPYVSRLFVKTSVFNELRYRDLKITTGFAYEDWDFNCRLFAAGFTFCIAKDTVFFYRQRGNSLLHQANALSARLIPHSELFEPSIFGMYMTKVREEHPDWDLYLNQRRSFHEQNFAEQLLASRETTQYVIEAATLDPEIEPQRIEAAHSYCPIPWDNHWGFCLERLYSLTGHNSFTDVVLLPWLRPGGAEKYILQILDKLHQQKISRRILVISGQSANKHEWVSLLPEGAVFIDLYNTFPSLNEASRAALLARTLLAVIQEGGRLHLKASEFSYQFVDAYGSVLMTCFRVVYYRFCDYKSIWRNGQFSGPWGIKFLRNHLSHLDLLVSDCRSIVESDALVFGKQESKYHVIYAYCDSKKQEISSKTEPQFSLLWASRIGIQKRPELLRLIAMALKNYVPGLRIDVYGQIEAPYSFDLFNVPGLDYRGPFNSFSEIPVGQYDALLYTSAFDGLPNIILEAMGAGLPVIAPDVGGIAEAVIDQETGYLIPDYIDETALVEAYVRTIKHLFDQWEHTQLLRENARRLIVERHGEEAFACCVARVFGVANGGAVL